MSRRLYSDRPIVGDRTTLAGAEAHHLLHVLRAKPGLIVELFDGSDAEFDAEVLRCGRHEVELAVTARREVNRESSTRLALGVALPKGDRQRQVIEKAVELGVARLTPLLTSRGEVGGDPRLVERLARYVVEASKQCGRNRLMHIEPPCPWGEWLGREEPDSAAGKPTSMVRWVATPGYAPLTAERASGRRPIAAAVGPEGGFTAEEIAAAEQGGWQLVGLGPRILRVDTAVAAVAALVVAAGSGS